MLLLPTAVGASLAGAAFWCLFWVTLLKLEEIPVVRHWLSTSQCLSWIKANPSLTLVMTEATNLLVHGISTPAGVLFTLGGTAVNVAFVCGYLPTKDVISLIAGKIRRSA
jgi:hypothetical protein